MGGSQRTVAGLLSPQILQELARPSDLRYGQAIFDRGGVAFLEFQPARVEAWVGGLNGRVADGGGQRRRTELSITLRGLRWHCSGNPKKHQVFCKHCVALALAVLHRVPSTGGP